MLHVQHLRGASRRWRGAWRHRSDVDVARDADANNAKIIKGRRKSTDAVLPHSLATFVITQTFPSNCLKFTGLP